VAALFAHLLYCCAFDVEVFGELTQTWLLASDVSLLGIKRYENEYAYHALGKFTHIDHLLSGLCGGQNRGCKEEPVPELHVGECLAGFGMSNVWQVLGEGLVVGEGLVIDGGLIVGECLLV
jgi:hypothetical protein